MSSQVDLLTILPILGGIIGVVSGLLGVLLQHKGANRSINLEEFRVILEERRTEKTEWDIDRKNFAGELDNCKARIKELEARNKILEKHYDDCIRKTEQFIIRLDELRRRNRDNGSEKGSAHLRNESQ